MPESDLALLTRAARQAGRIAHRYWRHNPKAWKKPGLQGPVSEADLAVDTALREMLTAARPDYGWLSEETTDTPERLAARRVFVVDPIDGTRAFLKGEPTFAHSLAVIEDGRTVAGVVFLPECGKLYAAEQGGAALLNDMQIRTGARHGLTGASLLIARPALDPGHWRGPPPEVTRHYRPSLAYRLCLVAEGRYDAMVTIRDSWDWDIAAGALIVERAGGAISNREGAALSFNAVHPVSRGVVTANRALHAGLIARLA